MYEKQIKHQIYLKLGTHMHTKQSQTSLITFNIKN